MKFSVVIPLYNKAPYVQTTIASVLAQQWQDFELIVVDDGSTDGGPDLVAAMGDPRIRLVRQANAGVSVARNRGIDLARGDWVAFLDADDWLHPDYLSTLALVQEACPEADTVAAELAFIPHDDTAWPPAWVVPDGPPDIEVITCLPQRWMQSPTLSSSSTAVRRSRLVQMQPCFPVGETQGEDLDLWFRVAELAPVAMAHKPLAAYRIELAGSLSSQHSSDQLPPFLERLRQRAMDGPMTSALRRPTLLLVAQHELTHARMDIAAGRHLQALRWVWRARQAITHRRWWFTALMCLMPSNLSLQLQRWRTHRTRPQLVHAATDQTLMSEEVARP